MIALLLVALAGQPAVTAGSVIERDAARGLAPTITAVTATVDDVAWIGYDLPGRGGDRMCWDGDGRPGVTTTPGVTRLEPPDAVRVLLRVERGQVTRVRLSSPECRIDAGGRTLYWLTGVRALDSVELLQGYASRADAPRALADGALAALALHAEPAAVDRLLALAREAADPHVRGQALFWLAQRAGDRAVGAITQALDSDPDTGVKRQAVFALSQLPLEDGVPRLIEVARSHSNPAVRKQAFFWLGQSKDPRALAFFAQVLRR